MAYFVAGKGILGANVSTGDAVNVRVRSLLIRLFLRSVTTVTSHPSLVTPARVYSQSRPHPNTP